MQYGVFLVGLKKTGLFVKMHICVKGDNIKEKERVLGAERACGGPPAHGNWAEQGTNFIQEGSVSIADDFCPLCRDLL